MINETHHDVGYPALSGDTMGVQKRDESGNACQRSAIEKEMEGKWILVTSWRKPGSI